MKKLIEKIQKAQKIGLFTHKNADPDALGSVGALFHILKAQNKECTIFLNETFEENFKFLKLENIVFNANEKKQEDFDLLISLDSASSERLGIFADFFKKHKNSIEIDHHKNRKSFAKLSFIKFYSSNAEVLLELFKKANYVISPLVATCLYTGLVGDTDSFKNASTTALSHQNALKLLNLKADINLVNNALFNSKTYSDFLIIKKVAERAEFYNHIAISYITEKDSKELNKEKFLTNDLLNLLNMIKEVEISVLIKQDKGKNFRISLRSSKNYNVGEFCARFGGGGHNQAAGMALVGSLKQVKDILLKELEKLGKSK